jgi:ATP-binding cassette, subfamily B, bacterial PglK
MNYISKISYILGDQSKKLPLIMGLFLLSSILESLGIGLLGPFIVLVTDPGAVHSTAFISELYIRFNFHSEVQFITFFGLALVVLIALKGLIVFNVQKYVLVFCFNRLADLRSKLIHAYLYMPYSSYIEKSSATFINNLTDESGKVCSIALINLLLMVSNLTVTLSLILVLGITDLTATIAIGVIVLVVFVAFSQFKVQVADWGCNSSESLVDIIRIINHALGSIKETKVLGCEAAFEEQLAVQAKRFSESTSNFYSFSTLPRYILEASLIAFIIVFAIVSLVLGRDPSALAATLGVFALAATRLLPSSSGTITAYTNVKNTSYAVDKLYLDLKELETFFPGENNLSRKFSLDESLILEQSNRNQLRAKVFNSDLTLESITYCYPTVSEPSLTNVSLVIKKGESIGIVGRSGAGKTTLVDVILGLLDPQSGDIKVDGASTLGKRHIYGKMIGYIPQSIFLLDDTIKHNIAFGIQPDQVDERRMQKAIETAQLYDLVESLPDGLQTVVGERGVRLSGGQRQRIGIARALYHEREILVLDEATSALDNDTENLVSEAIASLSGEKTLIIIAHRLTTLKDCDRVIEMDKGRIIQSGQYQQVVGNTANQTSRS